LRFHMPHPTFDQFIAEHSTSINRIINHHLWNKRPEDREDVKQEILLQIWNAWPAMDWKKHPAGLALKIAKRKAMDWVAYHRHPRRSAFKLISDEDSFNLSQESWAQKEYLNTKRAREEQPVVFQDWVYDLDECDIRLIELAVAIVNANGTKKCYPDFMGAWLPKGLGRQAIVRWAKRLDNMKNGERLSDVRNVHVTPEKIRLLKWCKRFMPHVISEIESGKMPRTMDPSYMVAEASVWHHRTHMLYRKRERHPKWTGSKRTHVLGIYPDWIRDGNWRDPQTAFRICRWIRQRWSMIQRDVEEYGWKTWAEIRRRKKNKRSVEWSAENPDHIRESCLRRKAARNKASREWNRRNREFCRFSHRRWVERKRADASSGLSSSS